MRKQSAIETNATRLVTSPGILTVLSVSPIQEDHLSLQSIISHSRWMLFKADTLSFALDLLEQQEITVVLCERSLVTGTWFDMLEHITAMRNAPSLIVTSRLANDRLWAEALNLGAWDVLAKPFDRSEVLRSVKSGWQHWHDQIYIPPMATNVITAAS